MRGSYVKGVKYAHYFRTNLINAHLEQTAHFYCAVGIWPNFFSKGYTHAHESHKKLQGYGWRGQWIMNPESSFPNNLPKDSLTIYQIITGPDWAVMLSESLGIVSRSVRTIQDPIIEPWSMNTEPWIMLYESVRIGPNSGSNIQEIKPWKNRHIWKNQKRAILTRFGRKEHLLYKWGSTYGRYMSNPRSSKGYFSDLTFVRILHNSLSINAYLLHNNSKILCNFLIPYLIT